MNKHGKDCICRPGHKFVSFRPTSCTACPAGEYMDAYAYYNECKPMSGMINMSGAAGAN